MAEKKKVVNKKIARVPKKLVQSKESYFVTMVVKVVGPVVDESQIVSRVTKRARVFQNALKGSKSVSLHEVSMKKA